MNLTDRLRRLDRGGVPESAPEKSGRATELRQRLDRLLGAGAVVTAVEVERSPTRRLRRPVGEVVEGRHAVTPSGETFLSETLAPASQVHGRLPVQELEALPGGARRLFPETLSDVERPEEIAFVDTETTGLAGGAGTVPFLIGVARWGGEGFGTTQIFLEDLDREAAQLDAFAAALAGVRCVVTYNGGAYDVPLLENRHVLNRMPCALASCVHLDLLPAARTLWRPRHPDCRLVTLERGVLGYERRGDIPGAQIPAVYTSYLRRGADRELAAVFEHNRLDLLSLAGLLWAAGRAADGHREEGSSAAVGLIHARRGRREEARRALEAGLEDELPHPTRLRALRELALTHRAAGRSREALATLSELRALAPRGDPFPYEEAAKTLEHRLGDLDAALALTEEALSRGPWAARDREALEHRRRRLRRRLGRT